MMPGRLALVRETLGEAASESGDGPVGIGRVVAVRLAGQENVPAMVQVVVPLGRVQDRAAVFAPGQPARLVGLVLEDEVNLAVRQRRTCAFGDLGDDMRLAVVGDRVNCVEAQTVATGGLADLIAAHARTLDRVDPHLTLEGLRLVWSRNQ